MTAAAPLALHVVTADDWRVFREVRLEALRDAPYAFESKLEWWQGERDTEPQWRKRLTDVPFNVIAYLNGRPAGMVSGTKPNIDDEIELISMWVAPVARGQGVAAALLDTVIDWAKSVGVEKVSLSVMETNARARAFYRRHGFIDDGEQYRAPDGFIERRMLRG